MSPKRFECFVAVVDDDEPVRRALARLIRSLGSEAEMFASGEEFLAALPTRRPDWVMLDLNMPGVDGFGVQARMAEARMRIPVIVITGHDVLQAQARALGMGAATYLRKPLDADVLREAIREAVRRSAQQRNRGALNEEDIMIGVGMVGVHPALRPVPARARGHRLRQRRPSRPRRGRPARSPGAFWRRAGLRRRRHGHGAERGDRIPAIGDRRRRGASHRGPPGGLLRRDGRGVRVRHGPRDGVVVHASEFTTWRSP